MNYSSTKNNPEKVCPVNGGICRCDRKNTTSKESMDRMGSILADATEDSRNRLMRYPGEPHFRSTSVDTQGSYTLRYARPQ